MKPTILIPLTVCLFAFLVQEKGWCQTSIEGKVLSVDGRTISSTAISIRVENPKDIFSSYSKNIIPDEDGFYQFFIREPGLYRITFRGVFHHSLSIPILIYDQPSMAMNILLLPIYYNDGAYFKNKEYMKWVRIYGNFNNYSFEDGKLFSLNENGSISAFIPVTSDTLRYQVRGLTYGRGPTPLPTADEYYYNNDHGFESVLYNDLPEDSVEIRYTPREEIPHKRHLPPEVNPQRIVLRGFISLENQEDENWIQPLSSLQPYNRAFEFVDREMSTGIPVEMQLEVQKKYADSAYNTHLSETFEKVRTDLKKTELHPQQKVILTMSYASILGWMARLTQFQQMRSEHQQSIKEEQQVPKIDHDSEVIMSIPEIVPPVHPAWRYNNGAVDYLLTETKNPQIFINYFQDVVKFNTDGRAVQLIASSIIRHFGSEYSSVEEMPVYQIILERYGENDLARDAHRAFEFSRLDD